MRTRPALYYEARVAFGLGAVVPALVLPAYAAFLWYAWAGLPTQPAMLARVFELGMPLLAAMGAAHVMAVEREARFDELRGSYPEHPLRVPLVRTLGALGLTAISFLATAVILSLGCGPFDWNYVVWPGVAPTLFLLGLTLLASGVFGNYWAAAGTGLGYAFVEALTRGTLTKGFFLFDHTWPVENDVLSRNRWLLTGVGILLMGVNAWWMSRRCKGGSG